MFVRLPGVWHPQFEHLSGVLRFLCSSSIGRFVPCVRSHPRHAAHCPRRVRDFSSCLPQLLQVTITIAMLLYLFALLCRILCRQDGIAEQFTNRLEVVATHDGQVFRLECGACFTQ